MSATDSTARRLPTQPLPEFLSQQAAARLAGLPDGRRIARHVIPDAWEVGPNGKRWPLYTRDTIEQWITVGIRDGRSRRAGGAEL